MTRCDCYPDCFATPDAPATCSGCGVPEGYTCRCDEHAPSHPHRGPVPYETPCADCGWPVFAGLRCDTCRDVATCRTLGARAEEYLAAIAYLTRYGSR